MDEKSYDFSFSNPTDSSSSYLNSYLEDETDVKPFGTFLLDYPFNNQTPEFLIQEKLEETKGSYEVVLEEIREVLKAVCEMHCLPLAQTWSLCSQQGQTSSHHHQVHHSAACISVVTSASYVFDPNVFGFYEVCSELHLLRGEGIAGKALGTNQPCFATDITAFSTTEYPLSDHAKVFGLGGAVAIRLRSIYTGPTDFILEFFLPKNCRNDEEQKNMLNSISYVIQNVSRTLRVINDDELTEYDSSSWISQMMEAQKRGESLIVSMESFDTEPQEEFKVINQFQQDSRPKTRKRSYPSGTKRFDEKRRVKSERNISLPVLQQYFPGSLKDAAKSIGVCPTTLKRICREHGIMRWPSRKIKKVGHSLKKLQIIIDSVQGAEGSIQLESFYTSFPELSSSHGNLLKSEKTGSGPSGSSSSGTHDEDEGVYYRVKAVYGEEMIRLSMSEKWGFGDLKRKVMRRFGIDDMSCVTLKYLDDDFEWVLLTCDADLEECMDLNMASKSCTIKLFLHQSSHLESGCSRVE